MNETRIINTSQKEFYENKEREGAARYLEKYSNILIPIKESGRSCKILDIGGASGYFARAIKEWFGAAPCEIWVLDTMKYDSWEDSDEEIHFVKESAFNIDKIFEKDCFDLVFANLVFHHLVQETYVSTCNGIEYLLNQIHVVLKVNGHLCVNEYYYQMAFLKNASGKLIYNLSSLKNPVFTPIIKLLGSKSAGVGVCFFPSWQWKEMFSTKGYQVGYMSMDSVRWLKRSGMKESRFTFILQKK